MIEHIGFGVLAGGKSSRMGTDKRRLKLGGKSFLEIVLAAGRYFSERIVSLDEYNDELEAVIQQAGAKAVYDVDRGRGPLEGIKQLLKTSEKDACLIVATDMPFLTGDLLGTIAERHEPGKNTVLICDGHKEPLCSIYSRSCIEAIEKLQKQNRLRPAFLFQLIPTQYIDMEELGFSSDLVRNINGMEDYARLTREITE